MTVGGHATAEDVTALLDQLRSSRGAPTFLRMDNGPEMIARALRDWCRLAGTTTHYSERGSP